MSTQRVAVVGGGIIGAAVARHMVQRVDRADVTLFEKESHLAGHQTGHNSGVIHAGLYYEPGSLKATLCRRGVNLLHEFAEQHEIPYQECGKIVVALDESELSRLDGIFRRATANGVPGVRMIDADEIRQVEPSSQGLRALHSPHTAIIDFHAVTEVLGGELRDAGGSIRLGHEVTQIDEHDSGVRLGTATTREEYDLVITCAGLQSDRVAQQAGDSKDPRIVPFYGDYFLLSPEKSHLVNGLIYPVPDPRYPFLGVHLTKRVDGAVILGPNAFLSLGREAYTPRKLDLRDLKDAVGFPGFWRFAAGNVAAAIRESRTAISSARFVAEARRYVPAIQPGDVVRGTRGIRAQAMDAKGRLVDDFVITGSERVVHVRNAPSPGATSALAIAEYIVTEALQRSGFGTTAERASGN